MCVPGLVQLGGEAVGVQERGPRPLFRSGTRSCPLMMPLWLSPMNFAETFWEIVYIFS